jgi:hypothetical protein
MKSFIGFSNNLNLHAIISGNLEKPLMSLYGTEWKRSVAMDSVLL